MEHKLPNSIEHLWDELKEQVRSMEAQPHHLPDLCQTLQHIFRGLLESMPRHVRAVLVAKRGTNKIIRQVVIKLCLTDVNVSSTTCI